MILTFLGHPSRFSMKGWLKISPLKVTPPTWGLRGSRAGTREEDFGRLRGGGEEGPLGVFCGLCRWWNAGFFWTEVQLPNNIHLYLPILTGKSNSWLIFIGSIILECWICFFCDFFKDFTMGFITFQHYLGEYVWFPLSKHRTCKGMKSYPPASSKSVLFEPLKKIYSAPVIIPPFGSSRQFQEELCWKARNQDPAIHQIIMECHWCVLNTCSGWEQGQNQEMHNIGSRWALSLVISRVISPFIGVK